MTEIPRAKKLSVKLRLQSHHFTVKKQTASPFFILFFYTTIITASFMTLKHIY
jgi:hypothetical protein